MNNNTKHKPEKDKGHSIERIRYTASRDPSNLPPGSQLSCICTRRQSIYNSVVSGFQVSLSAQSTPLEESSVRSNQRGSKTSDSCYGHPRCNLNLVRLFCFSLPLPVFRRLFLFYHSRGHKPTAPFTYCAVPDPRVKCGGAPVPVMPNSRRS